MHRLVSIIGIIALLGCAWLLSPHKKNINWRLLLWGLGFQTGFALFIFSSSAGSQFFLVINDLVVKVLEAAQAGSEFVFGRLAIPPGDGEQSLGSILAFQSFPTIIFFSSLMSILYFFRIMPWIIRGFAYIFTKLMKISGAESVVAASNIFVGIESAFTIKPHLKQMTYSELFTVLTVGMSTVASNILAIYIFSLKSEFPQIAGHLVSASFLSAPAALMISKLMMPEEQNPKTLGEHIKPHYEKENNLFSAIINGANSGVKLIVSIIALLIAVIGLVELLDMFLGLMGGWLGIDNLSLKMILGYIFYPFTVILGIPLEDAGILSKIIGERVIVTEVTAYKDLADAIEQGLIQNKRSVIIATYALCGFAHFASMSIFIGGLSALVPKRTNELAKYSIKALIAATLACMLTGAIAGVFAADTSILFGG